MKLPSDIASEIAVRIAPEFSSGIFAGVALENPERILLVILFCIPSGFVLEFLYRFLPGFLL